MIQLLFIALNIGLAWYHAKLIRENKPIYHGWWAAGFLAIAGIVSLLAGSWILFILLCLERLVVFNVALNVFRGLPPFHVSLTTTSILDKLQRKLVGTNGWIVPLIVTVVCIVLNFFR